MTAPVQVATAARWEHPDYDRIAKVRCNWDDGVATVWFEDGAKVTLDLASLVPDDLLEIDWWRTASNSMEIVVPHDSGWFEIPWDVIRRETDPEFLAYWQSCFTKPDDPANDVE